MRQLSVLCFALLCNFFLQAQTSTSPTVNFRFSLEPNSNKVVFTNASENLGEGAKKAFWIFGDGAMAITGATEGAVHEYRLAGTYQACLKIYRYPANSKDSVLLGSTCKSVTIQQACAAGFQWADSLLNGKPTQIIKFSGYGNSNASKIIKEVCWKFGDGKDTCITIPAGTPAEKYLWITHRYKEGGVYNACLKLTFDGGCVAEKCNPVNVPMPPPVDSCAANFTVNPITATPLGRKFVAQPWHNKAKKPLTICWKFGDGKDTCIQYTSAFTGDYWVEHTYAKDGQYEVCVTIKYDGGCESRRCNVVGIPPVAPPPPACEANILEAATNVANAERRFYAVLQASLTAEKICWKFGDGTDTCIVLSTPADPKQLTVSHRYPAPGNYPVCIRVVYKGGCVAERCKPVEIRFPQNNLCGGFIADSSITANAILFRANSIHAPGDVVTGYLWTFGDGTSANEPQVKHTYATPGTYTVCLSMKTGAGCETKVCKPVVIAGTVQPQLVLTPNPVISTLTAEFRSLFQQVVTVRIYNGNGIMLKSFSRNAVTGNNTWSFDLSTLPTGVYSMVVQSPNQFATAIFFKK